MVYYMIWVCERMEYLGGSVCVVEWSGKVTSAV